MDYSQIVANIDLHDKDLSVYIHWPYCISKCPYCDFNSHNFGKIDFESWKKAYISEINLFSKILKNKNIKTIFFGGGTPSLMESSLVADIISEISKFSNFDPNIEITLEANPTSSEAKKFEEFKNAGVNRLSIGIQSFDEESLKILGRNHNSLEAIKTIEIASNIFNNFSFDLIYGRHLQKMDDWIKELDFALNLAKNHISLYQLTIEKGTPYYKKYLKGELQLPDNELAAEMYDYTNNLLNSKGFLRYEISNYARKSYESKHNLAYWNYNNYIGIGAGAHSRLTDKNATTYAIVKKHAPTSWLKSALSGNYETIMQLSTLNSEEITQEIVMMGLRISDGLSDKKLKFHIDKNLDQIIEKDFYNILINSGFMVKNEYNHILTDKAMNLHNYILKKIFA